MDCLNANFINEIVKTTIRSASLKKTDSDKVLSQVNELQWAGGKVNLVQTNQTDRVIYVGSPSADMTIFKFPPNGKDFEEELIRAQETDRAVSVSYVIDATKEKIIVSCFSTAEWLILHKQDSISKLSLSASLAQAFPYAEKIEMHFGQCFHSFFGPSFPGRPSI